MKSEVFDQLEAAWRLQKPFAPAEDDLGEVTAGPREIIEFYQTPAPRFVVEFVEELDAHSDRGLDPPQAYWDHFILRVLYVLAQRQPTEVAQAIQDSGKTLPNA